MMDVTIILESYQDETGPLQPFFMPEGKAD